MQYTIYKETVQQHKSHKTGLATLQNINTVVIPEAFMQYSRWYKILLEMDKFRILTVRVQ